MSSLIFDLIVEIISLKLKQNKNIKGIKLCGNTKITSQYADDLWTAMKNDKKSFETQIKILKEFGQFSGLHVNFNKTEILRIGSLRNTDAKFYSTLPIKWSDGLVKILGFHIMSTLQETTRMNYQIAMEKVINTIKTRTSKSVSMLGRTQIVNSLLIPQFIFRMSALPSPGKEAYDEFRKAITNFIWDGKRARIKYNRLVNTFEKGGIKLTDLKLKDTSIKVANLHRIVNLDDDSFTKAALQNGCKFPLSLTFKLSAEVRDINLLTDNQITKDFIGSWIKFTKTKPMNVTDVKNQCIWFNSRIKTGNNFVWNKQMFKNNICRVGQLYNEQKENWFTYEEFKQKYPQIKINYLDYNTVIRNIPKIWHRLFKITTESWYKTIEEKIETKVKKAKFIYEIQLSEKSMDVQIRHKWEKILDIELTDENWVKCVDQTFSVSNCPKLRWFQFRLVNFILTTNVHRAKWNKEISPLCYYCKTEKETIMHLFINCEIVKKTHMEAPI